MSIIYFPMLKPKRGELVALYRLDSFTKAYLVPIFDIHKPVESNGRIKALGLHIEDVVAAIVKNWEDNQLMVDFQSVLGGLSSEKQTELLGIFLKKSEGLNFNFVAYTHTSTHLLNMYRESIANGHGTKSLCIKLERDDFDDLDDTLRATEEILKNLELNKEQVSLLIDFKSIEKNEIEFLTEQLIDIHDLLDFSKWQNVIVAASSFPMDMSGIDKDTVERVKRIEWDLWNILQMRKKIFSSANIHFADYGITHPLKPEMDALLIKAAGKIRYTSDHCWVISRGHKFKDNGTEKRSDQYQFLAKKLISEGEFIGENFSWGDQGIENCVAGESGFGSLEKWIQIDMNHHFTFVVGQISTSDE